MERAEVSKAVNATCAPVFIGNYFLADGHNSGTQSATATFVRLEGVTYVVTCRHVKSLAFATPGWTARLHAHPAIISLSNWSSVGLIPTLRDVDESHADISVCALPDHLMEQLARNKPKAPIDLDRYEPPKWDRITYCLAAGFPDRAKSHTDLHVASPMVEVIAHLASSISPSSTSFALQSELEEPTPYKLSGMSGGPIFAVNEDEEIQPIGIVFEGHPSGEDGISSTDSFLTDLDILVRGHVLTPETFAGWLSSAR